MNRQDWEKSKKQIRKLLDQGITELKELTAEASYLTDATANTVKMEVEVHRLRSQLEKAQQRLGREIVRTASPEGTIKQNPQLKKLIQEIRDLEKKIQADEKAIKKIPLSWSAAKAAVAKRQGGEKTAAKKGRKKKST